MQNPLLAISPLAGRYQQKLTDLETYLSEFGLIKTRLFVEIKWLIYICNKLKLTGSRPLKPGEVEKLMQIHAYFDVKEAEQVKEIEKTTNHDVKAIEYYLKNKLAELELTELTEFVHFGCTSEDINNLSYGLITKKTLENQLIPQIENLLANLENLGQNTKTMSMMGRTHGQPASPTTMGKEMINFAARIKRKLLQLKELKIDGKFNGATGNFNAHKVTYGNIDWIKESQNFIEELGLNPNLFTTQIEPHDSFVELFANLRHLNYIALDFATDMWSYISLNYFKQITVAGEIGSSTMPHKVNPIDFENGEGNLEIANGLFEVLERRLSQSRLQRDLSDSTIQRNIGSALGYTFLGLSSILKGLSKVQINEEQISKDLDENWAIVGEGIQSVLRREGVDSPYEKLKELTRGKKVDEKSLEKFIEKLEINDNVKMELKEIKPKNYSGLAEQLVELYFKQN